MIRILELISVPNHSRDSFIFLKLNTLSSWKEIVSVLSSEWCISRIWIYLNDADGFLQFRVMIRILELISVPNTTDMHLFQSNSTLCPHGGRLLVSFRVSGGIHLIGCNLMMQMFFFNFGL